MNRGYKAMLLGMVMTCAACAGMIMNENRENLAKLDLGMTKKEVLEIMGPPEMAEAYSRQDAPPIEVLFYYTDRKRGDGTKSRDECTPVVFDDGRLTGYGFDYLYGTVDVERRR